MCLLHICEGSDYIYKVYDIAEWKIDYLAQASGTRNKFWINAPKEVFEGKPFLFKESKTVLAELWAEKIAAEIGKLLNLNMMHVQFAKNGGTYGVIMENFVSKGCQLEDGGTLLSKTIPSFKVDSLEHYTIENVMAEITRFDMEKQFIELCLFDALIASTDRHCENWGIVYDGTKYQFAPIYDNGGSLGFNVHDEKLDLYASDSNAFQAFTNRTKTLIEVDGKKKPKVTLLLGYLYDSYEEIFIEAMEIFKTLDYNGVQSIVNQVPTEIMNKKQREWVKSLIGYRHKWLTEYRWKGVQK